MSKSAHHDQGVLADVVSPGYTTLARWLDTPAARQGAPLVVLDGVSTPANVGLIIRTVTAAGLGGVVLPRHGSPDLGPLVIKASAGVALSATVLRCATAAQALEALAGAGYAGVGLAGDAPASLYDTALPARVALVVGGETAGLSPGVRERLAATVALPLAEGVESLNAAMAAGIAAYELARRRLAGARAGAKRAATATTPGSGR